jgi:hypothetical protein
MRTAIKAFFEATSHSPLEKFSHAIILAIARGFLNRRKYRIFDAGRNIQHIGEQSLRGLDFTRSGSRYSNGSEIIGLDIHRVRHTLYRRQRI